MRQAVFRSFLVFLLAGAILALSAAIGVFLYVKKVEEELPPLSKLENLQLSLPALIYSRDGVKIGELFDEKRYPVPLAKINPMLVKAFLAAEDAEFYQHSGVDLGGTLRASLFYLTKSKSKQGGSTITQQLAKNLLLTRERTLSRKLKDILMARRIERAYSKDRILELYLNHIFLGNNSYGVEAAARNYFRKSNGSLSLAEAAMIAGLTPAPSAYAPTENLQKAKTRQRFVLDQMQRHGWAKPEEVQAALAENLSINRAESPNTKLAPYFMMEVMKQLEDSLKLEGLKSRGYRITTTLDYKMQRLAQQAVVEGLKAHAEKKGFRGPVRRLGADFQGGLAEILKKPFTPGEEYELAVVVDLFPGLDAVAIVAQQGLGILLAEDHRWALSASRVKERGALQDFANVLAIGDVVHVQRLERGTPKRIEQGKKLLSGLSQYRESFAQPPAHEGIRYYGLTDTEGVESAALVMEAESGAVRAMVGGENFLNSQFNRATQAKRQVGSSVKPLYYGLAQDAGFSPASQIDSPPLVIGDWKPENYDREFIGRTSLRRSLILSFNISSIQLFQALGLKKIHRHFQRLGLDWPEGDLSLALGSGSASLLQMVQAYSPFANQGRVSFAHYIEKIEDRQGKVVMEWPDGKLAVQAVPEAHQNREAAPEKPGSQAKEAPESPFPQVLSPQAAYVTSRMMQDVIRWGTGTKAAGVSPEAAGKTGTTNGYTDAWFMGVVPNMVLGVWLGYDDSRKSLGSKGTGGTMAAPIWREVLKAALREEPAPKWQEPEGINYVRTSVESGGFASDGAGISVPVVSGTEPGAPGARNALGTLNWDGQSDAAPEGQEPSDSSALRDL